MSERYFSLFKKQNSQNNKIRVKKPPCKKLKDDFLIYKRKIEFPLTDDFFLNTLDIYNSKICAARENKAFMIGNTVKSIKEIDEGFFSSCKFIDDLLLLGDSNGFIYLVDKECETTCWGNKISLIDEYDRNILIGANGLIKIWDRRDKVKNAITVEIKTNRRIDNKFTNCRPGNTIIDEIYSQNSNDSDSELISSTESYNTGNHSNNDLERQYYRLNMTEVSLESSESIVSNEIISFTYNNFNYFCVGGTNHSVYIYDVRRLKCLYEIKHTAAVKGLTFKNKTSMELLTGGGNYDNRICSWSILNFQKNWEIDTQNQISNIHMIKDRMMTIHGYRNNSICLWEKNSFQILGKHSKRILVSAISRSNSCLVTGGPDYLKVWDLEFD